MLLLNICMKIYVVDTLTISLIVIWVQIVFFIYLENMLLVQMYLDEPSHRP